MSKAKKLAAGIVELWSRVITVAKMDNIYQNDADNLYPDRVELIERNSVTAFAASNKLKSFIMGRGFMDNSLNELIVNHRNGINGYRLLDKIATSLKTHKGAFIHVNYDILGNVNYVDVLDYKRCRVSKEDSFGYKGKIFYRNWEKKKDKFSTKKDDGGDRWFYPFNPDKKVIIDQMNKDKKGDDMESMVKDYRGQVFFLNLDDNEVYPYAWLHPAYNDADNEYRISLYRNSNLRSGFLGKTIVVANGIDREDSADFEESVKDWLGAENAGSVMVVTPSESVDDPSKILHTIELKSNYDSKRFEQDERSVANNIRKAYLSIPSILIDPEDSFFGSSGESFIQAIEYYNKETLFIRERLSYAIEQIFSHHPEISAKDFTIRELGKDNDGEPTN